MRPIIDESAIPTQRSNTPVGGGTGHRFNAVKHGFYSAAILLPGDDAEAFHRDRLALFEMYRPQTIREAKLLDAMAQWQWQFERSSPLQARCDEQALEPAADAAGRIGEPLAHRRLHTTMDVTLHRQRLDRAVHRNERDLQSLQKLRRMGLIEGAVKLPPGCYMERTGEVVGPVIPKSAVPVEPAPAACQESPKAVAESAHPWATGSDDRANGKFEEPKENRAAHAAQPPRFWAKPAETDSRGWPPGGFGEHRVFVDSGMALGNRMVHVGSGG